MKPADYPPQEPLSALGAAYQDRLIARSAGIDGSEFAYGDDPYQRVMVYPAPSGLRTASSYTNRRRLILCLQAVRRAGE